MNKELTPLEALRNLTQIAYGSSDDIDDKIKNYFELIKKSLKDYENLKLKHRSMQDAVLEDFKKLKALEIIKKKEVNVSTFVAYKCYEDYLNDWNILIKEVRRTMIGEKKLTQEEYELLKEVLL